MGYTNLTNEYATRHLIEWQTLEELAQNDHYNRLPNGTTTIFFQTSAPPKWTISSTNNDKVLRVVSGAGGGSGGSLALSTGFTLAHSHTVNSHTHNSVAHVHLMHFEPTLGVGGTSFFVASNDSDGSFLDYRTFGAGSSHRGHKTRTNSAGGSIASGAATPATDSQLTNKIFAYFDSIMCVKD